MDAKEIGRRIAWLRKSSNLTQTELAKKLNVSNKAVSKWEVGGGFPDLEQIENLTAVFGITFNDLLGSKEMDIAIKPNVSEVAVIPRKKFSNDEWYSLDNAAKVYPNDLDGQGNSLFRMAAVLKGKVDEKVLQQALTDSIGRFPTIMVTIKRGVFWYYFEPINKTPLICEDTKFPMREFKLDGREYLFRVCYHGNRIAVEFFHSITDGTGAIIFLNSLLARYYQIKYGDIAEFTNCKNMLDLPNELETEDSFVRYSAGKGKGVREIGVAYHFSGKRTIKSRSAITHLIMEGDKLNAYAKSVGATITEFLTAIIIQATYNRQKFENKLTHPICVQVPANLRKVFPSETMRNFAYFANIKVATNEREFTFEEILEEVKVQLKAGIDKEVLQGNITANVKDEKNPVLRFVPVQIKKLGLNVVKMLLGDRNTTIGFSNLGLQKLPTELSSMVDRLEFVLKPEKKGGIAVSCVTYNNKCVFTISRTFKERYFEKLIAEELTKRGIALYVEGNYGEGYENL